MSITTFVFFLMFLLSTSLMLFFITWIAKKGSVDESSEGERPEGAAMDPFMYMGLFYVNPKDPRGWMPKRKPMYGWTVNFRNQGYANLFIILLVCTVLFALGFASSCL